MYNNQSLWYFFFCSQGLTEWCCYSGRREESGCWLETAPPSELCPGPMQGAGKMKLEMGKQKSGQEMALEHPSAGCALWQWWWIFQVRISGRRSHLLPREGGWQAPCWQGCRNGLVPALALFSVAQKKPKRIFKSFFCTVNTATLTKGYSKTHTQ